MWPPVVSPPRGTEQFDHGDSFGKNYIVVELAIVAIGVPIYFLTVFTVGGADAATIWTVTLLLPLCRQRVKGLLLCRQWVQGLLLCRQRVLHCG